VPLRPKKYDCHGATEEMHGVPLASHASATGLMLSGVPSTRTRLTLSLRIRSLVTLAARLEFDWLSRIRTSILRMSPPVFTPSANGFSSAPMTNLSASPKPASGPVSGLT
jgi:hypothetical protein